MSKNNLFEFIEEIIKIPIETEWVEFKSNYQTPEKIGEYISALANSACFHKMPEANLIYGIENKRHKIIGTTYKYRKEKGKGNEDLEIWLRRNVRPVLDFDIKEFEHPNGKIVIFFIPPASFGPVKFLDKAWIRIGSNNKLLSDFPEKEAVIWDRRKPFEEKIAKEDVSEQDVFSLLDYDKYYRLTQQQIPKNLSFVIDTFLQEGFLIRRKGGLHVTNLGAILLAVDMKNFDGIKNKTVRVITYSGINNLEAKKDYQGRMGYAVGFEGLIGYIFGQLPEPENISGGLRQIQKTYPKKALREFIVNALVHQDFAMAGSCPRIEIFDDRVEIFNPGKPLINVDRFIDNTPLSRNEKLANTLRRMGLCEQRGSGVDRAMNEIELAQLPAPNLESNEIGVKVAVYFNKELKNLTKAEQMRACYYHACLRHVLGLGPMTNASFCKRLGIEERNKSIASRIFKETRDNGLIKAFDLTNKSPRYASYVPHWA